MDVVGAQRLFRQQLGFARQHCQSLHESANLPARRSALQASLLALNLGLVLYSRAVLQLPQLRKLSDMARAMPVGRGDYRQEEIIALFGRDQSWLNRLTRVIDSMEFLAADRALRTSRPAALIASASGDPPTHWTDVAPAEMEEFICHCEELLDRHAAFDQEC